MIIEQITEDKFLLDGHVVTYFQLVDEIAKLKALIEGNTKLLKNIELLDCTDLSGAMNEAACMYNTQQEEEIQNLEGHNIVLQDDLKQLEQWV